LFRSVHATDRQFDVVFLDLHVKNGKGGRETLSAMQEINPGVSAVASSGFSDEESKVECEKLGFKWYLAKPMSLANLKKILSDVQQTLNEK
jgi:DNA-binding NtrC family response regulator